MPDNEARGCSSLFPRHLYIPPPPPRVRVRRRRASPEQIEEWLRKHFPEGGFRDPAVRACCRELRARRDDVRAIWAWLFPDRRGRPQGK
jgi:hypothetical protein